MNTIHYNSGRKGQLEVTDESASGKRRVKDDVQKRNRNEKSVMRVLSLL